MKRVMIFVILFATAGAVAVFISKSRWKDQTHYVLTSPKNHLAKSSNSLSVTSNGIDGDSAVSSSISAAHSRAMSRPRARFADLPRTDSEIFVSSGDVLAEARVDRDADAARRALADMAAFDPGVGAARLFFNHNGRLVTDSYNMGTYNFYGPDNNIGDII